LKIVLWQNTNLALYQNERFSTCFIDPFYHEVLKLSCKCHIDAALGFLEVEGEEDALPFTNNIWSNNSQVYVPSSRLTVIEAIILEP